MKSLLFGALLVRTLNAQGIDDFLAIPDVITSVAEVIAPLITPGIDAPSEADLLSPDAGVEINDVGIAASATVELGAEITPPSLDDLTSEVTPIADGLLPELPIGTADVIVDTPTLDALATTFDALGPAETAGVGVADAFVTDRWAWPTADSALDIGLKATETLTVDNGFEDPATAVDESFPAATEAAPETEFSSPSTVIDDAPIDNSDAVPADLPVEDSSAVPSDAPVDDPSSVSSDIPIEDPSSVLSDVPVDESSTVPSDVPVDDPSAVPSDVVVDDLGAVPSEVPVDDPSVVPSDVAVDDPESLPSDADVLGAAATGTDDLGLEPTAAPEPGLDTETDPLAGVATDDLGLADIPSATEDPLLGGEPTAPAEVVADPAEVVVDPGAGVFDATSADDIFGTATDAAAAVTDSPSLDIGLGNAATPTLNLDFTNFPAVLSDISELIFPTPTVDFNAGATGGAGVGGLAASEDPAAPSLDLPWSNDAALPAETAEPSNLADTESSDVPVVDVPISDDLAFATLTSEPVAVVQATDVPAELSALPPQPGVVAGLSSSVATATDAVAGLSGPDATPGASSDSPVVDGQSAENNVDAQNNAQNAQLGGPGGFSGEDTGVYDGQDYGEDWDDNYRGGKSWDDGEWEGPRGKGGKGGKGGHRPHPDYKLCPWYCFEDGNDAGPEAWYDVRHGPVIKKPHDGGPDWKREEPASGGFESFKYPSADDNSGPDIDTKDIPEWLWDQSGKRPPRPRPRPRPRPGPVKVCPLKCYHPRPHPRPTKTRSHHSRPTSRKPWTRTHTWHPWTSSHYPESTTAEPTQVTTTTWVTRMKTRHHHSPFTSVLASDIDWTGDTLATICPKTCNPFNPQLNFCDSQTTGCTTTGGKNYYCACRAGYRASKWNAKDFSKQFHVPGQPYVYVAPGVVCDKLCGDQLCTEVLLRPHCL